MGDRTSESSDNAGRQDSPVKTILLVEDEASIRQLIARLMRDAGFVVLEAADGAQAAAIAEINSIDILVTDVELPRLGGIDLAERLRAGNPNLKVVFVSGNQDSSVAESLAAMFLPKPFRLRDLLEAVKSFG